PVETPFGGANVEPDPQARSATGCIPLCNRTVTRRTISTVPVGSTELVRRVAEVAARHNRRHTARVLALRMRCSKCGKEAAEVVAVAKPRPRGVPEESALSASLAHRQSMTPRCVRCEGSPPRSASGQTLNARSRPLVDIAGRARRSATIEEADV